MFLSTRKQTLPVGRQRDWGDLMTASLHLLSIRYGGGRLGAPTTTKQEAPDSEMSTGTIEWDPSGPAMRSPKSPTYHWHMPSQSCHESAQ